MSALDRDKAQAAILEWEATEPMPLDDLLDTLEECVWSDKSLPQARSTCVRRAEAAEMKIAAITVLCEELELQIRDADNPLLAALVITTSRIRAALDGDIHD